MNRESRAYGGDTCTVVPVPPCDQFDKYARKLLFNKLDQQGHGRWLLPARCQLERRIRGSDERVRDENKRLGGITLTVHPMQRLDVRLTIICELNQPSVEDISPSRCNHLVIQILPSSDHASAICAHQLYRPTPRAHNSNTVVRGDTSLSVYLASLILPYSPDVLV